MRGASPALLAAAALAAAWGGPGCARSDPAPLPAGATSAVAARSSPRNADECRACRGDWGVHGLSGVPSCNCHTTDGGKRCTDGADCQGMCVIAPGDPEREVVDPGPPSRGFFVGHCSDLMTVWGCNRLITRGTRAAGPAPLAEEPMMMCVD